MEHSASRKMDEDHDVSSSAARRAPVAANGRVKRFFTVSLLILLLANCCSLAYYVFFGYQLHFHSDAAVANLLAEEIYRSGSFFPDGWNYVNNDLWVFFTHTWLIALLPFGANGYALHAVGSVLGCIFIGLATWAMCAIQGASVPTRLFAMALFASGFTPVMSEHVYGQQAYGTIYYLACAVLFGGWKYLHAAAGLRWRWACALLILVTLLVWANPQRAMIYYLLPLGAGMAALFLSGRTPGASMAGLRRPLELGALLVIASAVGALLYRMTLLAHPSLGGATTVNWLDFRGMADNLLRTLQGMVGLLGGLPTPGAPIASAAGLAEALRMVAAFAILALAPAALRHGLLGRHPGQVFFGAATLAGLGASVFIYVTTTMPLAGEPESSARYLVPGLLWLVLAVLAHSTRVDIGAIRRIAAWAALGVIALSAPFSFDLIRAPAREAAGGIERVNPSQRLVDFLEAQGLRYGYASFWQSGQLTVLSDGAVKVRQIQFEAGLPVPMRHLSANRWYSPSAWQGASFLLLAPGESSLVDLGKLADFAGAPHRRIAFEGHEIIVFDHNIAADFPTWDFRVDGRERYRMTAHAARTIGHYDRPRGALVADKGTSGALHFGPYQRLDAGRYLVTFDIEAGPGGAGQYGHVDIRAGNGRGQLASHAIEQAGRQRISLPMTLDAATTDIEFRVFSSGTADVSLFNIELSNDQHP